MIASHPFDPHQRELIYIDFRDTSDPESVKLKPTSVRVVSEHPLIMVDVDENGEPLGVTVRGPLDPPDPANDISNITRI